MAKAGSKLSPQARPIPAPSIPKIPAGRQAIQPVAPSQNTGDMNHLMTLITPNPNNGEPAKS